MMKRFQKLRIREKYILLTVVIFVLIGVFLSIFFPQRQKSGLSAYLEDKARVIAQIIALNSQAGMIFEDAVSIKGIINPLTKIPDISFTVVLKKDGKELTGFNEEKAAPYDKELQRTAASAKEETIDEEDVLIISTPIASGKDRLGTVILGIDKSNLHSDVAISRWITFIVALVLCVIGVIVYTFITTRYISKPAQQAADMLDEMGKGHLGNRVTVTSEDEIGHMMIIMNKFADDIQFNVIGSMQKISEGDLSVNVAMRDTNDEIAPALQRMVSTLSDLIEETNRLTNEVVDGNLKARGDEDKFRGSYREIVEGINNTLDALVAPVKEGADVLAVMASGDFRVRMEGEYHGDLELLKKSINTVAESLDNAFQKVLEAVESTTGVSAEISSSTEQMAAGAQEQTSQAGDVASAVEEMTRTIIENSRNASEAAGTAKKSKDAAEQGGDVVRQTVTGMNRIADVVRKSAVTIQELGKSSNQIGEIVSVIDDIADQTNLLALNAAIEAARAGEQGRGFAVVADEVRKLAERTTKATKEIAQMIKKIQSETSGAVTAMQQGTKEVENGIQLTDKAGTALDEIVSVSQKVTDMVTQIAAASEEQSVTSEEISKNVEAITTVTQETSSGIQQIAQAAETLRSLTSNLQTMVNSFKVTNRAQTKRPETSRLSVGQNGSLLHH